MHRVYGCSGLPNKDTFVLKTKFTDFFTLQPTYVSCGADSMDSHVPHKMLEELMSSEKHHIILNRS